MALVIEMLDVFTGFSKSSGGKTKKANGDRINNKLIN